MKDSAICDLDLSISLLVCHRCKFLPDVQLNTPRLEGIIRKLFAIVRNDDLRNTKTANNIPPDEAENVTSSNCGQRLGLHPFGEIIDGDYQELDPSRCFREGPQNVDAPLNKGPGTLDGNQIGLRLASDGGESLALATLLDKLVYIISQRGPVITPPHNLLHKSSGTRMTTAGTIVHFPQYVIGLSRTHAAL